MHNGIFSLRAATLCAALCLSLALTACGDGEASAPEAPPETTPQPTAQANDPNLGVYYCTSVKMDGMDIGPDGQWVQLIPGGRALIFLSTDPDEGSWTLSGNGITLSVAGVTLATGTLQNGTMTLDLMGAQAVFSKNPAQTPAPAVPAPQVQPETPDTPKEQAPEGYGYLYTPGDLCRVTYPTEFFLPSDDGLTDLIGQDQLEGVQGWMARLTTKETVEQWLQGLAAKAEEGKVENWESHTITVLDQEVPVGVYQDANGWRCDIVIDFGRDQGNKTFPMYGICLTFSGPEKKTVWNESIQFLASSLTLTDN